MSSATSRIWLVRVTMTVIAFVMFFPFAWMLSASLKTNAEVLQYPPRLLPADPQWSNYLDVFSEVAFARYMLNSLIVAVTVTAVALILHAMAGYALACLRFRGRNVVFMLILTTMMVPFYSLIVPLLQLTKELGWIDTYQGMIVPWIPHAFGIFLMRQYYMSFPKELREAATIDGLGPLQTFFRIVLPTSYPMLSALGIIYFIGNWDRFLWPLIVTNSSDMWTVPIGLIQFQGQYTVKWNLLMAAAVIASVPTIVLFVVLQRRIVEGVKMSGIKG
ncbi:carbohydrate ABC transporter permease [Conexibacter woesei]|uniref:Binding-protein-dependent transport systems inner membrane component n=1 Tax=Conexibacter woesei (strain DSM 14684 / CCUG 47730 / CIP 108061 / JCM 11494 / NBRC 100937 / ID131577) TaxID=469383 RepID=D3F3N3_CONWI|nr:carbohydrate ABC transporter permease [Conexibacter woesei]ADB52398.1 binding-protein-dependent transport systems inner membrane component [Conexibacter woesei DSM 14684]